jgi:hypothetical protein
MDTCRVCDARLFEGATFCARCLTPIHASDENTASLLREVDAAGGLWQPPPERRAPWRPDERHLAPAPRVVHSRFRSSALTLGLPGRIAVTVALLAADLMVLVFYPWSAPVFVGVSLWFIKDTWKKARIVVPPSNPPTSGHG